MKVIIAGSRTITDYQIVYSAVHNSGYFIDIAEIVCGGARGVDTLGQKFAIKHNIPVKHFPADWGKGPYAGHLRNLEMAKYADAIILVWDGKSTGSANMKKRAKEYGLMMYEVIVK